MNKKIPVLSDIAEEVVSELKETGKSIVTQVGKVPGDLAQTGVSQVVDIETPQKEVERSDEKESKKFVEGLYKTPVGEQITPDEVVKKKAEEKKNLQKTRQELHSQYVQSLNRPKPKEERPAEKVEREKKQEMVDLEQKEKKKPPVLVQRARERVEKYPGASG